MPSARLATTLGLLLLCAPLAARAELRVGEPVPDFEVPDLNGTKRRLPDLIVGPALVMVTPGPKAEQEVRAWKKATDGAYGPEVRRYDLLALDLSRFIPESAAVDRARAEVPPESWSETVMSVRGHLREALGTGDDPYPWVFTVGADGRVTAVVHGPADPRNLSTIRSGLPSR